MKSVEPTCRGWTGPRDLTNTPEKPVSTWYIYMSREQPIRTGTLHHAPVGRVRDGVDVWGHLVPLLALVHVDDVLAVDGKVLVGIYHHAEETGVGLGDKGRGHTHTHTVNPQVNPRVVL